MFSDLLRADRERSGLTVEQAARRLYVSPVAYRKVEAGTSAWDLGEVAA
jgi:transcriptional regulator with XRE-family HTH domain